MGSEPRLREIVNVYIPTKPEWAGRSASPVSWSNLLLPGNCNNCSKSTACCGLVSGPQGENILCCYILLLSHCTMAVEQYERENQLLCTKRHSYPCGTGQWCQPYLSTGFGDKQHTATWWGDSQALQGQPSWVPAVHTTSRLQVLGQGGAGSWHSAPVLQGSWSFPHLMASVALNVSKSWKPWAQARHAALTAQ